MIAAGDPVQEEANGLPSLGETDKAQNKNATAKSFSPTTM
jgi:hypothetical protein